MKIVFALEAKADLEEIFDYILEHDPDAAAQTLNRIRDQIGALAEMPQKGRAGRVPGTRELIILRTPFVVPYQVSGRTVEILRVYHGARKWPDSFEKEDG